MFVFFFVVMLFVTGICDQHMMQCRECFVCLCLFARLRGEAYCCWRHTVVFNVPPCTQCVMYLAVCVCVNVRYLRAACVLRKCCWPDDFALLWTVAIGFFVHLSVIMFMWALPQNLRAPCRDLLWRRVCARNPWTSWDT